MPPLKNASGEHPITAQELQIINLRSWMEDQFTEIKAERKEDRDVLYDVRDRVTRIEVHQEVRDGALERREAAREPLTDKNGNPLNKSIGSFLGDALVTALKTLAVAGISALILIAYDRSKGEQKQTVQIYQQPAQPATKAQP